MATETRVALGFNQLCSAIQIMYTLIIQFCQLIAIKLLIGCTQTFSILNMCEF
jgi:hypothetical protein